MHSQATRKDLRCALGEMATIEAGEEEDSEVVADEVAALVEVEVDAVAVEAEVAQTEMPRKELGRIRTRLAAVTTTVKEATTRRWLALVLVHQLDPKVLCCYVRSGTTRK